MEQMAKEKDDAERLKKKIASEEPVKEATPKKETSKAAISAEAANLVTHVSPPPDFQLLHPYSNLGH